MIGAGLLLVCLLIGLRLALGLMRYRTFALFILIVGAVAVASIGRAAAADMQSDCTQTEDWWLRIEACTQAIDSARWQGPDAAWAYSNRAVAHAELGNYLSAFDDHEQAVALNPADPVARNNKGNSHARFREYDRAIAEYSAAIALDPGYINAVFNRADIHLETGRLTEAVADYSQVIEAEPDEADAWSGRAEAYCLSGAPDASLDDRLKSVSLGRPSMQDMAGYLRAKGYLASPAGDATMESITPALAAWTRAGCP